MAKISLIKLDSFSKYERIDGDTTFIKPFIYNDKDLFYTWQDEPEDEELEIIESIIYKYVDIHSKEILDRLYRSN